MFARPSNGPLGDVLDCVKVEPADKASFSGIVIGPPLPQMARDSSDKRVKVQPVDVNIPRLGRIFNVNHNSQIFVMRKSIAASFLPGAIIIFLMRSALW